MYDLECLGCGHTWQNENKELVCPECGNDRVKFAYVNDEDGSVEGTEVTSNRVSMEGEADGEKTSVQSSEGGEGETGGTEEGTGEGGEKEEKEDTEGGSEKKEVGGYGG